MMKNIGCVTAAFASCLPRPASRRRKQDGVVLYCTNQGFRAAEPAVAAADRTRVSSALASAPSDPVKALGKDLVLLGHAKGKSPKAGDVEFFLLSQKRPVAAEPFPKAADQVVVVLRGRTSSAPM